MFNAGQWVHCGKVKDDEFQDGRKVSVNSKNKLLKLTNQKFLADGSVHKKIERFSQQGVEKHFLKDDQVKAKIVPRLNGWHDAENWLSMRPGAQYYRDDFVNTLFGEFNNDNKLHGRGIEIWNDGFIVLGYHEIGRWSTGNYIRISKDGWFTVGKKYIKDGLTWKRGTEYYKHGKEEKYDCGY